MKLNVLFINDVHGYLAPHPELFYDETGEIIETVGGYAHIAGLVEAIRDENPNTLFFDGGDTLHGTKPLVDSKGEVIIPILNSINPDAVVGHWDFGYGPERLKALAKQLRFPILGCNVYKENGTNFLRPTMMYEKEGIKIGVIGICAMIIDKVMPERMGQGLKFTSGIHEVPLHIKNLKAQGANVVVLLSHNGFPQDVALLEHVKGIDICLSAHTHNRIYKPIEINGARIVQCGCHGAFLGKLTLEIDRNSIKNFDYKLIKINSALPKSETTERLVEKVLKPYQDITKFVLGYTDTILHRYSTLNSTMDNFLLKAIAHATKTEIAFSNGWRFGAPIGVGAITENDLYNITPMNPPVSTVELTGAEIKQMLEENLERTFCKDPFGQMGGYVKRVLGLQINMRIENPNGHRIQEIYYKDSHLKYERIYKVSFVTSQGVPNKYGKNRREHDQRAVVVMKEYLKNNPVFTPDKIQSFRLV
ncbi:bifunctional metallophosphatase/5'-nucleotidase [Gelidibacter sp.]|uniref:bifunctional metallophosphatase/5'-nucleotidase n=1 Tax=Gelidibacter sp. TaxID=2018083 RepID=UPI002C5FEE31|nr:bifunctional metallophosphatase/5'-nucleotidase [Gelidibacter sp.]HUH29211.1 bifunctional metallophosphatase/5'-nucleotidase [Gelidibacter sp.]